MYIYIYTYIHTYIHTYIYKFTYMYMHACMLSCIQTDPLHTMTLGLALLPTNARVFSPCCIRNKEKAKRWYVKREILQQHTITNKKKKETNRGRTHTSKFCLSFCLSLSLTHTHTRIQFWAQCRNPGTHLVHNARDSVWFVCCHVRHLFVCVHMCVFVWVQRVTACHPGWPYIHTYAFNLCMYLNTCVHTSMHTFMIICAYTHKTYTHKRAHAHTSTYTLHTRSLTQTNTHIHAHTHSHYMEGGKRVMTQTFTDIPVQCKLDALEF